MTTSPLTPDEQARIDAWVNAIRGLARQYSVAHRAEIGMAIKLARKSPVPGNHLVHTFCKQGGIPEDVLTAVHMLIFG